jgi:phospholipase C
MEVRMSKFVVLMLENRSFDHFFGFLRSPSYQIDGLLGTEYNLENPADPNSRKHVVSDNAAYVPDVDPGPNHDARDVTIQLFSSMTPPAGSNPSNLGFVYDYSQVPGVAPGGFGKVMDSYSPTKLPVVTTLAKEFALCDHWYSSVPGPTWPNRFFVHAATSMGFTDNTPRDYDMRTIYERLSDVGKIWRIYYHEAPQSLMLQNLRNFRYARYFEKIGAFFRDCADGKVPDYSFLEPRYFTVLGNPANDQHPPNGVIQGEYFIADVYEAVRNSPQWNDIVLVIVWDEHGGFYDHVAPPAAENPDGKSSPECDFTHLGLRVPAIIVSPRIPKGTIVTKVFDHTSILATVKKILGTREFLTRRDASANSFEDVLSLPSPRSDTPTMLVRPTAAEDSVPFADVRAAAHQLSVTSGDATRPPSDLQVHFIAQSNYLTQSHELGIVPRPPVSTRTEHEAAQHVSAVTEAVLQNVTSSPALSTKGAGSAST